MRNITKTLLVATLASTFMMQASAYNEVSCDTNTKFDEYACSQCFDWGAKEEGDMLELLTDAADNPTEENLYFKKEDQPTPQFVALSSNARFVPTSDNIWEFAADFEDLYDEQKGYNVLAPKSSALVFQTKLGEGYKLESNTEEAGKDIGMLVYETRGLVEDLDGNVIDSSPIVHKECVLFTSKAKENGNGGSTPPTEEPKPETPKTDLPPVEEKEEEKPKMEEMVKVQTGAEHVLLIIFAMLTGLVIAYRRRA